MHEETCTIEEIRNSINQKTDNILAKNKKVKKDKTLYTTYIYTTTKNSMKIVGLAIIHRDTCIN